MTEKSWLETYSGESCHDLIAYENQFRTDSIVLAFEQAIQQKESKLGGRGLSHAENVILAVEALEREVNNAGYRQFFLNASAEYVSIIVKGLEEIGCTEVAKITQQAIDLWSESSVAELEACDEEYFANALDLAIPLFDYIKKNKNDIVLP